MIEGWANTVSVYQLLQDAVVDVRYTLNFKPFVGILSDAGTIYLVHSKILDAAGLVLGTHYNVTQVHDVSVVKSDTCYTLLSEPHWVPGYATAVGMLEF